jgi:hypothetical protein
MHHHCPTWAAILGDILATLGLALIAFLIWCLL